MDNWDALMDVLAAEVVVNRNEPITAGNLLRMMKIAENTADMENADDEIRESIMDMWSDNQ